MMELDYSFDLSPWETLLNGRKKGDTLPAGSFLALLEGESAETVEEAFQAVEDKELLLDVSALPVYSTGARTGERLRREAHLGEAG